MVFSTCYVKIRQVIVFVQTSFLEVVECIDEQRSLIEVVHVRRKPPFIDFSPDGEFTIRSTTCLDASDGVCHLQGESEQLFKEGSPESIGSVG